MVVPLSVAGVHVGVICLVRVKVVLSTPVIPSRVHPSHRAIRITGVAVPRLVVSVRRPMSAAIPEVVVTGVVAGRRATQITGGAVRLVAAGEHKAMNVVVPEAAIPNPAVRRRAPRLFAVRGTVVGEAVPAVTITGPPGAPVNMAPFSERAPTPVSDPKRKPAPAVSTAPSLTPPTTIFARWTKLAWESAALQSRRPAPRSLITALPIPAATTPFPPAVRIPIT